MMAIVLCRSTEGILHHVAVCLHITINVLITIHIQKIARVIRTQLDALSQHEQTHVTSSQIKRGMITSTLRAPLNPFSLIYTIILEDNHHPDFSYYRLVCSIFELYIKGIIRIYSFRPAYISQPRISCRFIHAV